MEYMYDALMCVEIYRVASQRNLRGGDTSIETLQSNMQPITVSATEPSEKKACCGSS